MSETTRTLADRYELGEMLGSGGMARVYRARDRLLDREVAAKILHAHFADDPEYLARFRREARAAAALNHPNVVAVYDTGEDDGTRYIVMEFVEGRTLEDALREEGPLAPERAAEIASEICAGLHAAHESGLVHRDIKPANVMLAERGHVKVMDFGIARATTSDTVTSTHLVMGTARYLSPEQARGERVDRRSDLYSLGIVMHELLTGTAPFQGDNPLAVATRHLTEPPPALPPAVPPTLGRAVMRALEKDPADRFDDARTMGAAIAGLAAEPGTGTAVLATAATEEIEAVPRRRPPWAFLAGLGSLLLGGFLIALAIASQDPLEPPTQREAGQEQAAIAAEEPPTAGPSPTEAPPPGRLPEEAFVAVATAIEEGYAAEELTAKARGELLARLGESLEKWREGDGDDALAKVAELRDKAAELAAQGEIVDAARAARIEEAIGALEASLLANPPPEGDAEDDGPGNSEGKGRGKKKGHGDEEDDD